MNFLLDSVVTFGSHVKFDWPIPEKNKAYNLHDLIRRNIRYLSVGAFANLYKALVQKFQMKESEKVLMRATKLIKKLNKCAYKE